jgi:thiamine transport system substrate-binding protein
MISRVLFIYSFFFSTLGFAAQSLPELVIYTYDTLIAADGLGPRVFPLFEKKYGCRIRALASGDGGQILTRLAVDAKRGKPSAHLVLGIDQPIWERLQPWVEPWGNWKPKGYDQISSTLKIRDGFLPYDYGVLAFIADRQKLEELHLQVPNSIQDLLKSEWKRNLILEDPRTSTPGLAFLLFLKSVLKENVWDFWKNLRFQWLTLTPGWDQAYGLFLKKEAPLVWSYVTSQAYHEEHGDRPSRSKGGRRYQAVLFKEGQPVQIEGVAWVKGAFKTKKEKELAQSFLEFMLSPEVQEAIPKTNWMMPVIHSKKLPDSFNHLPQPKKLVPLDVKAADLDEVLSKWNQAIQG